jgi:hypothetical protein
MLIESRCPTKAVLALMPERHVWDGVAGWELAIWTPRGQISKPPGSLVKLEAAMKRY